MFDPALGLGGIRTRVLWLALGVAMFVPLGVPGGGSAQTITEFSAGITPGSRPVGIAPGPDGNLWFTEYDGSRVARITTAGAVTEFSAGITPGSGPGWIVAGSDGNLWFTEYIADRIGRITPAGEVVEFSAGITPGSDPPNIAAGPDGNLWFTEEVGRVGRISTAGVVTEFSAGITSGGGPRAIAAGPDGNVWFTEFFGNRVGRITPTGVVSEFSAGISPGSGPWGIAAGPDGNIWFTERSAGRVGRITPAGVVTEFSAGISPGAGPQEIVGGPDGNLWFTERSAGVGRITPAGVVTEFGVSFGASPRGIAVGPDGNLWFTAEGGNRVGRITLDAGPPAPVLGRAVNAAVVRGRVLVAVPSAGARAAGVRASQKGLTFVPLTADRQIPVGSFLNTKRGTVRLVSATGSGSKTQAGQFSAGVFQVLQSRARRQRGLTVLRLKGSGFSRCRARGGAAAGGAKAAQLSRRTIRRLRASARGRFRTHARHSAATVRGTVWLTADRCDGTLTSVKRGKVAVRDFRRKRTVVVRAGKSYLARPRR